jgi:TatD DNase family protein
MVSSVRAKTLAESNPRIYFTAGVHPHDVKEIKEGDYEKLRELLTHPKAAALGETGLDYHYDHSPREVQREHFARQIALAKESGKPLVIHSREAEDDTMDIMLAQGAQDAGGTMHCFAGGRGMARKALDMGFFISVGGTLTFTNADALREVIKTVPIERLLLETDCPYLAPKPLRGKRNEPAYLKFVVDMLADIKGLSREDVARITTLNAMTLFRIGDLPSEGSLAYPIRDSLYLNITNRCTNECAFCVRNTTDFVKGHNLRLTRDPSLSEILHAMKGFENYKEVVFCGYGEPFMRFDIIREVSKVVKSKGVRVRVNTNGHALLINSESILPQMEGLVDALSVSLNFDDPERYEKMCKPDAGPKAYESLKEFVKKARAFVPDVTVTAVDMPGVNIAECRRIAEEELGVKLRVRQFDVVG